MKLDSVGQTFVNRIIASGRSVETLAPADGVGLMLQFYREVRAEGCDAGNDSDMLLYQWGTYDWGEGEAFEFNLTRQLIGLGGEDEDILQLSLTFSFESTDSFRELGEGNRWCQSPEGIELFREFILQSPAFSAIQGQPTAKVRLEYEVAG